MAEHTRVNDIPCISGLFYLKGKKKRAGVRSMKSGSVTGFTAYPVVALVMLKAADSSDFSPCEREMLHCATIFWSNLVAISLVLRPMTEVICLRYLPDSAHG
jgi:hypothetical protein